MTEKNFNYISFGGWTGQADDAAMMTRGRMFEYTPTDIERRLERLDSAAVAFLQSLPTFLCSEVVQSGDEVAMFICYGRITSMEYVGREVRFNFDTQIDFGRVVFPDLDTIWTIFGADRLQLFRTHWAVRNGNARDILEHLAPFRPTLEGRIEEVTDTAPAEAPVEPPPRAKQILGTADSVESFLRLLFNSPDKEGAETFFRGHEDARFELTPSLLRRWPDGGWQFMPNEDRLCQELLIGHHDEFQGDEYCFDRLVRMQHYKLPTRLLDISGNPLVALFFACHSTPAPLEADGEVI
ncbi:MAG: FRG domain-containing protein, partial [Brevundimonas sp.]